MGGRSCWPWLQLESQSCGLSGGKSFPAGSGRRPRGFWVSPSPAPPSPGAEQLLFFALLPLNTQEPHLLVTLSSWFCTGTRGSRFYVAVFKYLKAALLSPSPSPPGQVPPILEAPGHFHRTWQGPNLWLPALKPPSTVTLFLVITWRGWTRRPPGLFQPQRITRSRWLGARLSFEWCPQVKFLATEIPSFLATRAKPGCPFILEEDQ